MHCAGCPLTEGETPTRSTCCGETEERIAERLNVSIDIARVLRQAETKPLKAEQLQDAITSPVPKIGQSISFNGRHGVVCAPNDPKRSGTYKSEKYGDIPVKLENRKDRRTRQAKAR
jgi:hypothetical protein